ncbi:MAG: hypothetical protein KJZ47_00765 [Gemmatimonadales bacterium]|nr:hypothetical protein [Gemmatimonadales bacterium]
MSPLDKSSVHLPNVFSPLAKTLLDAFSEGVIVFDHDGKTIYINQVARDALPEGFDLTRPSGEVLPELADMGGRLRPLRVGELDLGEAVFLPPKTEPSTLADREKEAIVRSLDDHDWRLAETAKSLGISRTTLWRRLRAYGLHRDGRSKWAQAS